MKMKTPKKIHFYVEDERTVGRLDFDGEDYMNGEILRGGEWVPIDSSELITGAKPIEKEKAEELVGADAIAKK